VWRLRATKGEAAFALAFAETILVLRARDEAGSPLRRVSRRDRRTVFAHLAKRNTVLSRASNVRERVHERERS
jgi:hypothetical protein